MSKRVNLKAIQFSGVSFPQHDEVEISDATTATSFSSGNGVDRPFTISFWLNLETVDFDGVFSKHSGVVYSKFNRVNKQAEMEIFVASGKLYVRLYADPDQNGTGVFSFANALRLDSSNANARFFHEADTWFHCCITYDGLQELESFRVYKNSHPIGQAILNDGNIAPPPNPDLNVPVLVWFGTAQKNNYSGMIQTTTPTTLGSIHQNDARDRALPGKLADICRFNRVLTHAEVQEIYNGGKVKNMKEHSAYDDLVHWWKMGDDLDSAGTNGIIDYVGGYHGTMKGNAKVINDPSLPTDRIGPGDVIVPSSWGRTRQPKNLAGDHQVYIHGGLSGDMPTADPSSSEDGYHTETQRFLHLYWKAASTTASVTAWGYSYASGQWSELIDTNGNPVKLEVAGEAVDTYRVFEIAGVDKVYFKQSGTALAATDLFAAAASTF